MAVVRKTIERPQHVVFAALTDPHTYPHWLVGCKAIRDVDKNWPRVGSKFHHRVGLAGPVTVSDNTKVLEMADLELLSLEVRTRPFGRGRATFRLGRSGSGTEVELDEVPIGLLAPTRPLADPVIAHRNHKSLNHLAKFLESDGPTADT